MSAYEPSQWGGFPFTQTRIRTDRRLSQVSVNDPGLQDAAEPAAVEPSTAPVGPGQPLPAALRPVMRGARPIGRQDGVRLLPLEAFVWGNGASRHQVRTRPDHVLIWVTGGQAQLHFPRQSAEMQAGDLRHVPAGTAFAVRAGAATTGQVVLISARLAAEVDPPLPDMPSPVRVGGHAAQLETVLRELARESADPGRGALSCLMNLLSLRLGKLVSRPHPEQTPAMPDHPLIDRFLVLAGQRLGSAGSVAELAAELGSSTAALDQACIATRGKRAIDLIHDLQLERAADLLRHTDRPILRIAADLGYSSHAHLARAFVAATGRTPEAFRAQSR